MSRKRALLIVILSAAAAYLFLSYVAPAFLKKPALQAAHENQRKLAQKPAPKEVNYGLPVRLKIPKINVDANIAFLGLTPAGDMDIPTEVEDVGWYKYGTVPGNKGSAVVAGHLIGKKGEPGVFINLDTLQKGDIFSVIDSNAQTITFTVRETRSYGQTEKPKEVFNSSDGVHLNLITCTGDWIGTQSRYSNRLVVFADKIPINHSQ